MRGSWRRWRNAICDQPVLKLLRAMLRAGVMEDGQVRREAAGTAQGGVISPVMCNVYLHRLDRAWDERDGVLARYADDLVVMCWSRSQAEAALERLTALLADLRPGAEGGQDPHRAPGGREARVLTSSASTTGWCCSRGLNGKKQADVPCPLARGQGVQHARDRIRELTGRSRLLLPVKWIVEDLNRFLGGWAAYFRFGNSAARFEKIRSYARMRLALFISKTPPPLPASSAGRWLTCKSPNQLGLVTLSGNRRRPQALPGLAGKPNAGGERRR